MIDEEGETMQQRMIQRTRKTLIVMFACIAALNPVSSSAQSGAAPGTSNVNGFIEFEGGGRPTERVEVYVQTPTGGSRFRIFSESGGTFALRSIRPGTYEFNVKVPKNWPYQDGFAELIVGGSSSTPTTYTVTVFLRPKDSSFVVGVGGRTISPQETDKNVAKEARRHYRRGVNAAHRSKSAEAIDWFRKALEVDPNYLFALNDLGVQLTKTASYGEAITVLMKATALAPKSYPPHLNLALAFVLAGRNDDAAVAVQVAIEIDASSPEAPFLRGVLERRRGNRNEAVVSFQKAYDLGGADVIYAQFELGQLFEELNQPEAAARAFRIFLSFVTTGPQAVIARRRLSSLPAGA